MMTWFSILIASLIILQAKPTFSISLRFSSSNFPAEAGHSLLGDAHFVDGGHAVQLSRATPLSFGIILHSTPYRFNSSTSFSSNFTFEIGNGVALTLEVRVSKAGDPRPVEPLISHRINLGETLKGEDVLLGLMSLNENPEQITTVYSWTSEIKEIPKWLHSIPFIPHDSSTLHHDVQPSKKKSQFLSCFILATGCGAFASLTLFFVWSVLANRQKPQEEPSVDFKYEKIGVLEANNSKTTMK
ncbi:hypothetical protein LXL04_012307 [Taraxacum kok-saghyz]